MATIRTRFLVISDTHSRDSIPSSNEPADVAIHCGDLTMGSKLHEFKAAINLIKQINAPLKLVIAGNHDFTLDPLAFQNKIHEAQRLQDIDPLLIEKEYGYCGQVRELFDHVDVKKSGIRLLDEGTHYFTLNNGASLTVYASPYTPSFGEWGFQYKPDEGHEFAIGSVDLVMTHGPPRGILDHSMSSRRAGCEHLFDKVARCRPRMHCFGHIHGSWGAKLIAWRKTISEKPSHLTDIDNGQSTVIEKLSNIEASGPRAFYLTSHCAGDANSLQHGRHTLFVNAAIEGSNDFPTHPAWLVDLDLQRAL
ncbi:Metallo-dependent phosphatase-like protein [Aspergillus pseudonomiae]|uniref:Metallo-dependent phosphatase-like protein n=1 Tax=Aspergillus pseudonomiae TaxID=1506151 RepID=A0A5N7DKZ4_9EURO|nr:Metallo-dependent phosphatase-like protein [Aspergillus pseudonomiae]KAB8259052.1 Metallo-dependent phosphatase-like protein [Aspergillus pseudonomiae]KAE8406653.1 Metallo-dependent phosphatase-like protein [Aspergillus pseudonomiae]